MFDPFTHNVLASIEGLNLSTDLVIHESVVFGNSGHYEPIHGITEYFVDAHQVYGRIPIEKYAELARSAGDINIDEQSFAALRQMPQGRRLGDYACIAFPVTIPEEYLSEDDDRANTRLLEWLLRLGDQIIDLLRLFLYKPGDERRIGRVGGIGRGIHGLWLYSRSENQVKFLARKTSAFALMAEPVSVGLENFRTWYSTDTFHELCSVACLHPEKHNANNDKIFAAMRSFRESREVQSLEGRFRQLMPLIEDLANRHENEKLKGNQLRRRIAQVAWYSLNDDWDKELPLRWGRWNKVTELETEVERLWSKVRNSLSHTCRVVSNFTTDPAKDLVTMEVIAISMIRAMGRAYFESNAFEISLYDSILRTKYSDLAELDRQVPPRIGIEMQSKKKKSGSREQASLEVYGIGRREARTSGICVKCRSDQVTAADFRDDPSRKEFAISGWCQNCQDKFFK